MERIKLLLIGSLLAVLVTGCGEDDNPTLPEQIPSGSVVGTASDALIQEARVAIYSVTDQLEKDRQIAPDVLTDQWGMYAIEPQIESQLIMLELTGGYYFEEVSGKRVFLSAGERLRALVHYTQGSELSVMVTPLTTIAAALAQYKVEQGTDAINAVNEAYTAVTSAVKFDILATTPANITYEESADLGLDTRIQYGFYQAARSQQAAEIDRRNGFEPHSVTTSIELAMFEEQDIRSDGLLDGKIISNEQAVPVRIGSLYTMSGNYYRSERAQAMLAVAGSDVNQTSVGVPELFDIASLIASNTESLYSPDEPTETVDGQPPVITPKTDAGTIVTGSHRFDFDVTDKLGVTSIEYKLDDVSIGWEDDLENPSVDLVVTGLDDGEHRLTVRAIDMALNAGEFDLLFVVDNTNPTANLTSPSRVNANTYTATGVVSDQGSAISSVFVNGVEATIDGEGRFTAEIELVNGANTVSVVVSDLVGNSSTTSKTVTVDQVAAEIELDYNTGWWFNLINEVRYEAPINSDETAFLYYTLATSQLGSVDLDAAALNSADINYIQLTPSDSTGQDDVSDLVIEYRYLVNGEVRRPWSVLTNRDLNDRAYLPLTSEYLDASFVNRIHTDDNLIQVRVTDGALNVSNPAEYEFQVYFDLPSINIQSDLIATDLKGHVWIGARAGLAAQCHTDAVGDCRMGFAENDLQIELITEDAAIREYDDRLIQSAFDLKAYTRFSGDKNLCLTPLNNIAAGFTEFHYNNRGEDFDAAVAYGIQKVASLYGVDISTTCPGDLSNPSAYTTNELKLAMVLEAFSRVAESRSATGYDSSNNSLGLSQRMYRDAKDGILDGHEGENTTLYYGIYPIDADDYTTEIARKVLTLGNQYSIDTDTLMTFAQQIATNNADLFGSVSLEEIDADEPVLSWNLRSGPFSENFSISASISDLTAITDYSLSINDTPLEEAATYLWSIQPSTYADGEYDIKLSATDGFGNTATKSATRTFDTRGPSPVMSSNVFASASRYTLLAGFNDSTSNVTYVNVAGINHGVVSETMMYTVNLDYGVNKIPFVARDTLGNENTGDFTVILLQPFPSKVSGPIELLPEMTRDETGLLFEISIDGQALPTPLDGYAWMFDTGSLDNGEHTIVYSAIDQNNNEHTVSKTFTSDNDAPFITQTSALITDSATYVLSVEISELADLTINGESVNLNGGTAYSKSVSLVPGLNTFELTATDGNDNVGTKKAQVILVSNLNARINTDYSLTPYVPVESNLIIEAKVNGNLLPAPDPGEPWIVPLTVAPTDGDYVVTMTVSDGFGHDSWESGTLKVDRLAGQVVAASNMVTANSALTFKVRAEDPAGISAIRVGDTELNKVNSTDYQYSHTFTNAVDNIEFTVEDGIGNISTSSLWAVRYNSLDSVVSGTVTLIDGPISDLAPISIDADGREIVDTNREDGFQIDTSNLEEGFRAISLRLANTGTEGFKAFGSKVDNTAPNVSITSTLLTSLDSINIDVVANDESGIDRVLVNGQEATLSGTVYRKTINLSDSVTDVSVQAFDRVGNEVTVNTYAFKVAALPSFLSETFTLIDMAIPTDVVVGLTVENATYTDANLADGLQINPAILEEGADQDVVLSLITPDGRTSTKTMTSSFDMTAPDVSINSTLVTSLSTINIDVLATDISGIDRVLINGEAATFTGSVYRRQLTISAMENVVVEAFDRANNSVELHTYAFKVTNPSAVLKTTETLINAAIPNDVEIVLTSGAFTYIDGNLADGLQLDPLQLSDGMNQSFSLRITTPDGRVSSRSFTTSVDNTSPVVAIDTNIVSPQGYTKSFQVSINDASELDVIKINGMNPHVWGTTEKFARLEQMLDEPTERFEVYVKDAFGRETTQSFNMLQVIRPSNYSANEVTLIGPHVVTHDISVSIGARSLADVDGDLSNGYTISLADLSGSQNITISATDRESGATGSMVVSTNVDNTPPDFYLNNTIVSKQPNIVFDFNVLDSETGVDSITVNGNDVELTGSHGYITLALVNGLNNIEVVAKNPGGATTRETVQMLRVYELPATVSGVVDILPAISSSEVSVEVLLDNVSKPDADGDASNGIQLNTTDIEEGSHVVKVVFTDAEGTTGQLSQNVDIDNSKPTLEYVTDLITDQMSGEFTFKVYDLQTGIASVRVNGTPYTPDSNNLITVPVRFSDEDDWRKSLNFEITDSNGQTLNTTQYVFRVFEVEAVVSGTVRLVPIVVKNFVDVSQISLSVNGQVPNDEVNALYGWQVDTRAFPSGPTQIRVSINQGGRDHVWLHEIIIDNEAPTATLSSDMLFLSSYMEEHGSIQLAFNVADRYSDVVSATIGERSLDLSDDHTTASMELAKTELDAYGNYSETLVLTDSRGNQNEVPVWVGSIKDTTCPNGVCVKKYLNTASYLVLFRYPDDVEASATVWTSRDGTLEFSETSTEFGKNLVVDTEDQRTENDAKITVTATHRGQTFEKTIMVPVDKFDPIAQLAYEVNGEYRVFSSTGYCSARDFSPVRPESINLYLRAVDSEAQSSGINTEYRASRFLSVSAYNDDGLNEYWDHATTWDEENSRFSTVLDLTSYPNNTFVTVRGDVIDNAHNSVVKIGCMIIDDVPPVVTVKPSQAQCYLGGDVAVSPFDADGGCATKDGIVLNRNLVGDKTIFMTFDQAIKTYSRFDFRKYANDGNGDNDAGSAPYITYEIEKMRTHVNTYHYRHIVDGQVTKDWTELRSDPDSYKDVFNIPLSASESGLGSGLLTQEDALHTVEFRAIDVAGNETIESTDFRIHVSGSLLDMQPNMLDLDAQRVEWLRDPGTAMKQDVDDELSSYVLTNNQDFPVYVRVTSLLSGEFNQWRDTKERQNRGSIRTIDEFYIKKGVSNGSSMVCSDFQPVSATALWEVTEAKYRFRDNNDFNPDANSNITISSLSDHWEIGKVAYNREGVANYVAQHNEYSLYSRQHVGTNTVLRNQYRRDDVRSASNYLSANYQKLSDNRWAPNRSSWYSSVIRDNFDAWWDMTYKGFNYATLYVDSIDIFYSDPSAGLPVPLITSIRGCGADSGLYKRTKEVWASDSGFPSAVSVASDEIQTEITNKHFLVEGSPTANGSVITIPAHSSVTVTEVIDRPQIDNHYTQCNPDFDDGQTYCDNYGVVLQESIQFEAATNPSISGAILLTNQRTGVFLPGYVLR